MNDQDRTAGAILFGICFVLVLKVIQIGIEYFFPNFSTSNQYAVIAISGFTGALIAAALARKLFPGFFKK